MYSFTNVAIFLIFVGVNVVFLVVVVVVVVFLFCKLEKFTFGLIPYLNKIAPFAPAFKHVFASFCNSFSDNCVSSSSDLYV